MKKRNHNILPLIALALSLTFAAQTAAQDTERKYNYFFLEAAKQQASGDAGAAFDLYKHALEVNPDGSSALYEIAQLHLALHQYDAALKAMEKATTIEPDNYWYADALANLYQRQGMTEEAIDLLEQMTTRFPNKSEALFELMELYGSAGLFDKVIDTLNRLEERMGKNEQITMEKFRIYLTQKNTQKAFEEIESLVKEYPLDMRYLVMQGDVYLQNDRPDEAYQAYQKVLANDPGNPMATLSLANYYNQTNQTEKYEQQLDSLLFNKLVNPEMKLNIMRQHIYKAEQAEQDSTEVIALFERVIEQDQEDTQIPMLYAQYLLSKEMDDASGPVLEHILQLDPANTAARMTLLGVAVRKNDFDWVIRITEPGVEVSPNSIEFYYYLGISYYQKEMYDKALGVFRAALNHLPKDVKPEIVSDFYNMIGDILHMKEQIAEAFAAYDSALTYSPENVGVLNNYAYYISILRSSTKADLDKAEEMSYKTVRKEPANSTYLDTYAWILFIKGNYAEAKLYIDDAMRNGGNDSDVIVEHAGDIYYMTGDKDAAIGYWKQAQQMGSDSKTLKKKISRKKYIPQK
ncbi:tetratricopeptide repeat protein [Bacteroides sp. OttesenSCG-928-D19]|nr:tetratricopeptide repeat protein [Bacteroides sp. OttesenSCG-928-N06]MDL2305629.1 tetratricopeptide repeat protein [Bacteroides sp. OttesenSCG-928-D19]